VIILTTKKKEKKMKIAITSQGNTLDAAVDPRFGRCRYFIIFDDKSGEVQAVDNSSLLSGSGAGIQAAQFLVDQGVEVLLTGNIGPNASQVLNAAGIKTYIQCAGTGQSVLDDYRNGRLSRTDQANVPSHFGMSNRGSSSDSI